MRRMVLPLFVIVLVCSFSARGQRVIEEESSAAIDEKAFALTLVIQNDGPALTESVQVDLLDTKGGVRSNAAITPTLGKGKSRMVITLPLDESSVLSNENLAWYRVRYSVGRASGTIAVSQLLRDLYDLIVMATTNILPGMTYRVRIRAVNRFTNLPVPGVDIRSHVKLDLRDKLQKQLDLETEGRTDSDGFAVMDLLIPVDANLDGDGSINVIGRKNGIVRKAEEDLNSMSQDVNFLMMTDKPIYQPEQVLRIRGIMLKGVGTKVVLPATELEIKISDEDDTDLFRQKVKTSAFGVAAVEWTIPSNARLGEYQISVIDADDNTIGGQRIKISRYDLPNFVVDTRSDKTFYLPADHEAQVKIKADYLFGKPVEKGRVRVVEELSREWDWEQQKYNISEGQVREGDTDQDGTFTAKLDLVKAHEDFKENEWRKYRDINFAAYFTDPTTNKTEQRRFDIRITREPIHVYLIGRSNDRNPSLPIRQHISTFYADGRPAQCSVEVIASVEDEDKFRKVARVRTNASGAGRLFIMRPKIGDSDDDLDIQVKATDQNGQFGVYEGHLRFSEDEPSIQLSTDKTIYKPGEMIKVSIVSSLKNAPAYIDVVNGWSAADSEYVRLKDGKAQLVIPYRDEFKGALTIGACIQSDDDCVTDFHGIIFPSLQGITVDAQFNKDLYKPNEEGTIKFSVSDRSGNSIESALGAVIFDRAVEERARTDADFGGMWRGYYGYLGYGGQFGGINIRDLNELDTSKPISDDQQLVAEMILYDDYYLTSIFRSKAYDSQASTEYIDFTYRQFEPITWALIDSYKGSRHPVDMASLEQILSANNIDFPALRDPWGIPYQARFLVERGNDVLTFVSAGPDKRFDTKDDFTAYTKSFAYFAQLGNAIDTTVKNYHEKTGRFIRDPQTLLAQLGMREMQDRFGRPYRFEFDSEGRNYLLTVKSLGRDGFLSKTSYGGDDFIVWTNRIDYFQDTEKAIRAAQSSLKQPPMDESEFRASLSRAGIGPQELRDGFGNPLYVTIENNFRYSERATIETVQKFGETKKTERTVIVPVSQQLIEFHLRSIGKDGTKGTYDDFTLTRVVHIVAEQTKDDPAPVPVFKKTAYSGSTGNILGVITDPAGAVIPNVKVKATNDESGVSGSSTSDESGRYLILNLSPGNYTVSVPAAMGFSAKAITGVNVVADKSTEVSIVLSVVAASVSVEVTSGVSAIDTTSNSIATTIDSSTAELLPKGVNFSSILKLSPAGTRKPQDNSTPRLREYFPESLVWQPELLTDKDGKAELKFKMADNMTTWKMYAVASTKRWADRCH